eukprot:14018098-Alexandrium_andersonii.AAC.1
MGSVESTKNPRNQRRQGLRERRERPLEGGPPRDEPEAARRRRRTTALGRRRAGGIAAKELGRSGIALAIAPRSRGMCAGQCAPV